MRFRAVTALVVALCAGGALVATGLAVEGKRPDKVTICHGTGSESKPFTRISVSKNALPAHLKHGDDMMLMNKNACPSKAPSATPGAGKGNSASKVTICHHTGSSSNPFVELSVSESAIPAHLKHGDDVVLMNEKASCRSAANASEQKGKKKPRGK